VGYWAEKVNGLAGRWVVVVFRWPVVVFRWAVLFVSCVFVLTLRDEIAAQTRPVIVSCRHYVLTLYVHHVVSCSCRVFSVVRRVARRVWPIWTSKEGSNEKTKTVKRGRKR
jgi:hypothetical protein